MCAAAILLAAATSALAQATNVIYITHPAGLMNLSVAEGVTFNSGTVTAPRWVVRPAGRLSFQTGVNVAAGGNPRELRI